MRIESLMLAIAVSSSLGGLAAGASAQTLGSGFTYQGLLADNGAPANGSYDLEFALYSVASGGTAIQTVTQENVAVAGGLVNTVIDFGTTAFDGQVKWVEVRIRPGASSGAYTTLTPRQSLTGTPYSLGLPMPFQRDVQTGNADAFRVTTLQSGTAIKGVIAFPTSINPAVLGVGAGTAIGVGGESDSGVGVSGSSTNADGVEGVSLAGSMSGVHGVAQEGYGVRGEGSTGGFFSGIVGVTALNTGTCNSGGGFCTATLELVNTDIGNLITAEAGGSPKFRVDGNGGVFASSYNSGGADVAEFIPASEVIEAGDVVEIDAGARNSFRRAAHANSTAVAGVASTRPGLTMNGSESGESAKTGLPRLALSGRVPVKVTNENGVIHAGDLLVSSSQAGRAMRAPASPRPGTVIGKALETLAGRSGTIEMLVMLR